MDVDIRDSASLKPDELDILSQVLRDAGSPLDDEVLDGQVERFSRLSLAAADDEVQGFLFGSLERIGGTPCVLWGLGATRANGRGEAVLRAMTTELYRRAAISFPDEDVLVAGRFAHPTLYQLFGALQEPVPRPGYRASGEDRAWGRRLAKRFGCDDRYDDRAFRAAGTGRPEPLLDIPLAGEPEREVAELLSPVDAAKGDSLIAFGWAAAESLAAVLAQNGR
ncbi:MAG TPA: hypothetical protein VI854_00630 [Acidimicrobiia bacterium]|nr:hypothetical protein [Acidimicrobiia bacterium]